jgi:predicted alpha/beta-hydrolase family hydrolase
MIEPAELLLDGPASAEHTLVLAHGAGAPMDSAFLQHVAGGLAHAGLRVARFEFPYMRRRREGAPAGRPDPAPLLLARWRDMLGLLGHPARLVIGGKSLGGRMASMIADETGVRGLVCLGYPFHAPGAPERPRIAHLRRLRTPALFVQGTRDRLGLPEEIAGYDLSPAIRVVYVEDGDHSFEPRARSGRTHAQNLDLAIDLVWRFILALP